jgi:signal transduction histidine kinase
MQHPKLPDNELKRLEVLRQYQLLDTLPENDYDDITKLISTICKVPISLITLLDSDRNFFKSHYGIPFNESPRNISFCGHAIIESDDIFMVQDSRLDERFHDNPLVKELNAIFYAGVPLINPEGFALGTICVFDHQPRVLTDSQIDALIILSKQVVNLFESRRKNFILEKAKNELEERNKELKNFAAHVSHDLKSPLANIMSLTYLLKDENQGVLSSESLEYLDYIEESTGILKDYIDGILLYYKADELIKEKKETLNFQQLFEELEQILVLKADEFVYPATKTIENINKPALTQIFINLIDNGLKYNFSKKRNITIAYDETKEFHVFSVSDNGVGIPEDKQAYIFELFKTLNTNNKKASTGIGLSTVQNLVHKLGGMISVSSELNKGSTFTFTIKK